MKVNQGLTKGQVVGFRYFMSTLSAAEKTAYHVLRSGLLALDSRIAITGVSSNRIDVIYDKIKRDNPLLYYVEKIAYQYSPLHKEGTVIPQYRFDYNQVCATNSALFEKINAIVQKCSSVQEEWEKEKIIHDYLCSSVTYDDTFKDSSYECVGPLLFGRGVCEGISKASKLLFDYVGIESLIVHGKSKQRISAISNGDSHAWNVVRIDGTYSHLDVTFDLTVMTFLYPRYDYFNLSDEDIRLDHEYDSANIPICNMSIDYYTHIGALMTTQREFSSYLEKCIKKGEDDIVVKLPKIDSIDRAEKELMTIAQSVLLKQNRRVKQLQISCNPSQRVFHLHALRR